MSHCPSKPYPLTIRMPDEAMCWAAGSHACSRSAIPSGYSGVNSTGAIQVIIAATSYHRVTPDMTLMRTTYEPPRDESAKNSDAMKELARTERRLAVPRTRVELVTRGFSVRCSTN